MRWNIVCATMAGTNHQSNGINCQDQVFQLPVKDKYICITMADGAGSMKNASHGSDLAVKEAKNILEKTGQDIFSMTEQQISELLLGHLTIKIQEACQQLNCRKNDLASTLLFFVCNGEKFVAGNIGDGLVGCIASNEEEEIILDQERGRFINYSFFITDNDCQQHMRIAIGDYDPTKVYFLLTDGSCDCLYETSNHTYANALHIFAQWMRKYPFYSVKKALHQTMHKVFPKRTDDDCAIALITTQELAMME